MTRTSFTSLSRQPAIPKAVIISDHREDTSGSLPLPSTLSNTERIPRHRSPIVLRGLFLPVVLMLAIGANAQSFHLSGGFNGSNVSEAGPENWKGRAGYQFGLDVLLGRRVFMKPGVHFVVRNLSYTSTEGTVTAQEFKYTSRSVSVPVMLGVNLLDTRDEHPFNAYVMAGPTALINLSTDLPGTSIVVSNRGTQWYVGAGAGLSYGPVFVEGGYNAAMSNIFDGDGFRTNPRVNYSYIIAGIRLRIPHAG